MILIWVSISLIMVSLVLLFRKENRDKKLPPGPKGFPIFGCLHLLGDRPHRSLHQLSLKYGPIMHMRLGLVPTIIVSSPASAELFLKTHDPVFASRPLYEATKHMAYAHKDFAFSQYGPYWRNMRKMTTLELLSNHKINSFRSMREEELGLLIDYLREAARNRVAVDLSSKVSSLNIDMTCLMVFGKKYGDREFDERGFKAMIQEVLKLFATPNLGNFIPYIAALDLQGLTRRMKSVSEVFDGFLERIIDEHVEFKNDSKTRDFVDVMLDLIDYRETEYQIDRSNIKAIVLSLFIAAIDTSATVIEWALAELIKHPHVMKKVQEELEEVVGLDRMVKELELDNLEYLNMVVKEILRLHPPISLIPRENVEECIVNEFHVPKKSQILINTWAIGRDPSAWIDPDKFFPERFIDSQINVRGRDFELIPFGYGRRGCPGMQLSIILIRLIVAQLVHCFNWELPNGVLPTELDMREEFGLTSPRAQSLMLFPIYRLRD